MRTARCMGLMMHGLKLVTNGMSVHNKELQYKQSSLTKLCLLSSSHKNGLYSYPINTDRIEARKTNTMDLSDIPIVHQSINQADTTRFKIRGQLFTLTAQQKQAMAFFKQYQVISNAGSNPDFIIQISICDPAIFSHMLQVLQLCNYQLAEFPPIKTNNLEEVLPPTVANHFRKLNINDLNELYKSADFFKCKIVQKCCAATLACKVYFTPTLKDYLRTKQELGIKSEFNQNMLNKIRDKYPTIGLHFSD